jgi:uncharacterized repeat protein (TIGR02543 family)
MPLSTAQKSVAVVVATATAGISSLFLGASSASAAPTPCGPDGTIVSGNICQEIFGGAGTASFTPSPAMSNLQVLLVGGGGNGENTRIGNSPTPPFEPITYGPNGGGGGQVAVFDFSADAATSTPLTLVVGGPVQASTATDGTITRTAAAGESATGFGGGASGNGNPGWTTTEPEGSGGGAGAPAPNEFSGGAGTVVDAIAPAGPFSTDPTCYGGGGAVGLHGGTIGTATCGGGYVTDGATTTTLVEAGENSGGGGGGGDTASVNPGDTSGTSGLVVVRWTVQTVTLTFASDGHGATVAPETVPIGGAPTAPANPTATGFVFKGWYTNAGLTTPADFSAALTTSTTFFAKWDPVLAATGGGYNPMEIPIGIAALAGGLVLALVGMRRRTPRPISS